MGREKPFVTLFDFARRVDLKRIGKRSLEMLARAGAFDTLDPNRRRVFESVDALVGYSAAIFDQKGSAQVSLFGEAGDDLPEPRLSPVADWLPAERLSEEFKAIGFYLSGHPLDDYMTQLRRSNAGGGTPFYTLEELTRHVTERGACNAKLAGIVAGRQERKSARGNRFAFAQLSDPTGAYEVTLFSETLEKCREHLETGAKVVVTVEATMESDQLKLLGRSVAPADVAVANAGAVGLRIFVENPGAIPNIASVLGRAAEQLPKAARGPVELRLQDAGLPGDVDLDLGSAFPVTPEIKGAVKSLDGVMLVEDF